MDTRLVKASGEQRLMEWAQLVSNDDQLGTA